MLTKGRGRSCASTLSLVALLSFAGLGHPAAQMHGAPAGAFATSAIGSTRLSHAGQEEPGETLQQAGRPKGFSRLAQLGSGRATWYQLPGRTASGEKFKPNAPTAAHKTLPLGTRVRVVNKKNNRSMVVRINDRMPAKAKAKIDLSRGSARALGVKGNAPVVLQKAQ
jgi:rare lipoprotein A